MPTDCGIDPANIIQLFSFSESNSCLIEFLRDGLQIHGMLDDVEVVGDVENERIDRQTEGNRVLGLLQLVPHRAQELSGRLFSIKPHS